MRYADSGRVKTGFRGRGGESAALKQDFRSNAADWATRKPGRDEDSLVFEKKQEYSPCWRRPVDWSGVCPLQKSFGLQFSTLRDSLGMHSKDVAKVSGISRNSALKIENPRVTWDKSRANRLNLKFDVGLRAVEGLGRKVVLLADDRRFDSLESCVLEARRLRQIEIDRGVIKPGDWPWQLSAGIARNVWFSTVEWILACIGEPGIVIES